ncbi:MAG: cupredoxin domain-containing protein [Nitrosopumilus sp.]|nr:cupredoxin domain-containing protein [Nitrosopumilus sp.]
MVNTPIYIAASLLALFSMVAIASSGNLSVFAQNTTTASSSDAVNVSIVTGASTLTDKAFSPNPVEVKVGQKVIWTNDDTLQHTVTSGSAGSPDSGKEFDSGLTKLLNKGDTFEYTFTTAGEFPYYCQLHPNQVGTVIVK